MTGMCSLGRVVSAQLGFLQLGKTQLQLATPYELPCLQVQQASLCEGNSKYTGSVCPGIAINKVSPIFCRLCQSSENMACNMEPC